MNDIDLALLVSAPIGTAYRAAKESCSQIPQYSLVCVRSLASLCCDNLAELGGLQRVRGGLVDKINALQRDGADPGMVEYLHQLRLNGNKGAHPEKYNLTPEEFANLAIDSLAVTRRLLEAMVGLLRPTDRIAYEVSPARDDSFNQACFEAIIEGNVEAQHRVAMFSRQESQRVYEESERRAIENGGGYIDCSESDRLRAQAHYWFGQAALKGHIESMFAHGEALAGGCEGEENKLRGVGFIERAAARGNPNANAFIGGCMLQGSDSFEVDYPGALACFQAAAESDHPAALAGLGMVYSQGLGVPQDAQMAYEYTRRAAEAGFPQAQFNAYVMSCRGQGTPVDQAAGLAWLDQACAQGLPEALWEMARLMRDGIADAGRYGGPGTIYISLIPSRNDARLRLAELRMEESGHGMALLEAANLVQQCYEAALDAGDMTLAGECYARSENIAATLRRDLPLLMADPVLAESALVTDFLFDEDGHPYKKRVERAKALFEWAKTVQRANALHVARIPTGERSRLAMDVGSPTLGITSVGAGQVGNHKVGRNEACPCGSGKKYKVCCLRRAG